MTTDVSERALEEAIERALLRFGPDAFPEDGEVLEPPPTYMDMPPGGYLRQRARDYDRHLCLLPADVVDFMLATQPQQWKRLAQHHGRDDVRDRFLHRLAAEIGRRGTLDVLRNGIKDSGVKLRLAYFRPASGLNEETRRLHAANLFSVARQVRYSEKGDELDLVVFLNGLPIFTAELKNPLSGQDVRDAIEQYRTTRDPREPLLAYGRCLAHFAVDAELVYVTTRLDGPKTRFLPFNRGWNRGAGNPPVPPTREGYATSYLWEETWARDSVLDLVRQFHPRGRGGGRQGAEDGGALSHLSALPPAPLRAAARRRGEEAGAGAALLDPALGRKRQELHPRLAGAPAGHPAQHLRRPRVRLDRGHHRPAHPRPPAPADDAAVRAAARSGGEHHKTSVQLKEALEAGKTIIVSTLQKYPVIAEQIGRLPGRRFAVIVDEAHSSQSGESTKPLKAVLSAGNLDQAEREDAAAEAGEDEVDNLALAEAAKRGQAPNLSLFAFTATPKQKTLELFGRQREDGKFEPHDLYSMRQAIEEGFILDVLANYTTYKAYWRLLKRVEDDPRYDRRKAAALLKSFVELHPHSIGEKVRIVVEHFASQVSGEIGGKAKAMIVTRSRLHAVRYQRAMEKALAERGHPWKSLVAFSGTVEDGGHSYTEAGMNGLSEAQTARTFERPEYRFLIVAEKFQTGFDQPLLHTMYVDKKLSHVHAVQTLSRLNRTHPEKEGTMVLDFANEAEEIRSAFADYYETTLLSEGTDPNLLYEIESRLAEYPVFTAADVDGFARLFFSKAKQDRLYSALAPVVERFRELPEDERRDFRGELIDYVRRYAFLAQVLTFADSDLEKLYVFARHLRRLLTADRERLPVEVQQAIDMESYRLQQTGSGRIQLERGGGGGVLVPVATKGPRNAEAEELETLSRIIADLNERFGSDLGPEHRVTLEQMIDRLDDDAALDAAARANTRENVRLTFDHKVERVIQEIVDSNFDLYKRITDDRPFGSALKDYLFDHYLRSHRSAEELIRRGESKTLEFKSTLRWNLVEDHKDDRVTHAALKSIAAFLNTEGGDLLLGVADDKAVVGIERDQLDDEDKFMRHLAQVVRNALGDRAGTSIDPQAQIVDGKTICVVSCQRSPEPVFLRWKGMESEPEGDFFVRSGPGTVKLSPESAREYVRTRFGRSDSG